jgi:hypothetical protein
MAYLVDELDERRPLAERGVAAHAAEHRLLVLGLLERLLLVAVEGLLVLTEALVPERRVGHALRLAVLLDGGSMVVQDALGRLCRGMGG